jgi:glycerol kinase
MCLYAHSRDIIICLQALNHKSCLIYPYLWLQLSRSASLLSTRYPSQQGTTSSRVIAFDSKCSMLAISQRAHKQIAPQQGWVEHDPIEIYNNIVKCYQHVIEKAKLRPRDIASIGITNQRETTIVWNKKTGEPLYNAIVWMDTRTKHYVENMKQQLGGADAIRTQCGLPLSTYFSAFKLKWILDNIVKSHSTEDLCFGTIDSWLIWVYLLPRNSQMGERTPRISQMRAEAC